MPYLKTVLVLFVSALALAPRGFQQQSEPIPPGRIQAREATRRYEKVLAQDRPQPPAARPDWEKARLDAGRLLVLARQIHGQLQPGPEQLPAGLAEELKEVEKLAKRLRKELLL